MAVQQVFSATRPDSRLIHCIYLKDSKSRQIAQLLSRHYDQVSSNPKTRKRRPKRFWNAINYGVLKHALRFVCIKTPHPTKLIMLGKTWPVAPSGWGGFSLSNASISQVKVMAVWTQCQKRIYLAQLPRPPAWWKEALQIQWAWELWRRVRH